MRDKLKVLKGCYAICENLKTQKAQVGRNGIGTAVAFFID
jgi:hypothetical protein